MVIGMAGRVHCNPIATSEPDRICLVEANRWHGHPPHMRKRARGAKPHTPFQWDVYARASPGGGLPRKPANVFEWFLGWQLRDIDLGSAGNIFDIDIGWFGGIPHHAELAMSDDVGPRLGMQPTSAAEVVRVTVRHDDRVDALERISRRFQPRLEGHVRVLTR